MRSSAIIALAVVLQVLIGSPAAAHVELVSSTPSDQTTLAASPSEMRLVFSTDMEPAGPGVVLSSGDGEQEPAAVAQPEANTLIVEPEQSLNDGGYLLSWTVAAGDAHPRSGSIGFAVAGSGVQPRGPGNAVGPDQAASPPEGGGVESLSSAKWLGWASRWLSLLGALLGIGVLAFASTCLTGSIREVRAAAFWVRRAGIAVVLGTIGQLAAAAALLQGGWLAGLAPAGLWSVMDGSLGMAALMRIAGGAALLFGAQLSATPLLDTEVLHREPNGHRSEYGGVSLKARDGAVTTHRLNVGKSKLALAGAATLALSYLFDGHTVTAEPAWLVRIADVAHVVGAGVWVGGVAMMAWVLMHRRRKNVSLRAGELAVRFSTIAAAALVGLTAAGAALTIAILDLPGELFGTDFGRLLLLKIAAVGGAAAVGGCNHRFVIPDLIRQPSEADASERLRVTVRVEAWILVAVVGVTAALVGAASS